MADKNMTDKKCECNLVMEKFHELYQSLLEHDGFGEIRLEMRFLKAGQKEVIIHCGKQYRFVVDFPAQKAREKNERGCNAKP